MKRKSVPKSLKDLLWDTQIGPEKGQGECFCCGITINSKRFEAGHIIAVANGGSTTLDNLRCICGVCNKSMGTQNLDEFKEIYFPNRESKPELPPKVKKEKKEIKTKKSFLFAGKKKSLKDLFSNFSFVEKTGKKKKELKKKTRCCLCLDPFLEGDPKKEFYCCLERAHEKCWQEYILLAWKRFEKTEIFFRRNDCPLCLDKKWGLLKN